MKTHDGNPQEDCIR
ncbi:hypothetical protein AWZ03_014736, partial [Drosophila navojoa]